MRLAVAVVLVTGVIGGVALVPVSLMFVTRTVVVSVDWDSPRPRTTEVSCRVWYCGR